MKEKKPTDWHDERPKQAGFWPAALGFLLLVMFVFWVPAP